MSNKLLLGFVIVCSALSFIYLHAMDTATGAGGGILWSGDNDDTDSDHRASDQTNQLIISHKIQKFQIKKPHCHLPWRWWGKE